MRRSYTILASGLLILSTLTEAVFAQKAEPQKSPGWPEEICPPLSRFSRHGTFRTMATPLLQAVLEGKVVEVRNLIAGGADVNEADSDGNTPLILAAGYADVEIMKDLIKAGSKLDVSSNHDFTPLFGAVKCSAAVNLLLDAGVTVDYRTRNKDTALMHAALSRNLESVKLLLKAKADINAKNVDDRTPLIWAIRGGNPKVVEFLLEAGAKKELDTELGSTTALNWAASNKDLEIMRALVAAGAKVKGKYGIPPLIVAATSGYIETVRLLLNAGVDPKIEIPDYGSVIVGACTNGHTDVVRELLKAGAAVYSKNDSWPSLITAVRNERLETMDVL